jgi:hypothetical protein
MPRTDAHDWPDDWGYDRYRYRRLTSPELRDAVKPLLDRLSDYDALRLKFERLGGSARELADMTKLLTEPVPVKTPYRYEEVALTAPDELARQLAHMSAYALHLDVRQLDSGMPVYYLCRTRADYWSEYSLVVEDLYLSRGYAMHDARFARLMHHGHETFFLRLSPYRSVVGRQFKLNTTALDDFLVDLGQHVFQAAWHEDQQAGMAVAEHLDLPAFRQALELLYLCLSGELCELRQSVNIQLLKFFDVVYEQAAIGGFLRVLADLDGAALNELPERALDLYGRLSRSFNAFLDVEVPWGYRHMKLPLYKLVFGNFGRLTMIGRSLSNDPTVGEARTCLEETSVAVIQELVGTTRTRS